MNEAILTPQELQIKMLERRLTEVTKERDEVLERLENTVYWATLAADLWEKSRRNILAASRGELDKPVLRLNEGQP